MIRAYLYRSCVFLQVLLMLALVLACGKKTSPVPPQSLLPQQINDLSYTLDENGAALSWSRPEKSISGRSLGDQIIFEIFRAEIAAADYCPDCPVRFEAPFASLTSDDAGDQGLLMTFQDNTVRSGYRYLYKVRPRIGYFTGGRDSNTIGFWWQKPIAAPPYLNAAGGDSRVDLSWQAPQQLLDGSAVQEDLQYHYQVFRRDADSSFRLLAIKTTGTMFSDSTVKNGTTYFYQVRAVRLQGDTSQPGPASEIVSAMPVDRTPPAAPSGLRIIQTAAGIKLIWDMVEDHDLDGYRVYRRRADEKHRQLIGQTGASAITFTDIHMPGRGKYYYSLTAIDNAEPPNESESKKEIAFTPSY